MNIVQGPARWWTFHTTVVQPATYFSPGKQLWERYDQSIDGWNSPRLGLAVFGGQPDPADGSHFSIDFKISAGAATQTIDGWLMADDSVKLKVRTE